MYEPPHVAIYPSSIGSSVHETYHFSQLQLSERLARDYPELAYGIFTEAIYRLEESAVVAKKQMLQCMVPWVETMDFSKLSHSSIATQEAVIQSFLLATLRHVENHPDLVRKLWTSVAKRGRENIRFVFEHLMLLAVKKQNPEFVALSKNISLYLGRCAPATVVDLLVTELSPLSQTSTSITAVATTPPQQQRLLSPHSNPNTNNNNNEPTQDVNNNNATSSGNSSSGERQSNPNSSSGGNKLANPNSSSGNRDGLSTVGNSGSTPLGIDGDFRVAPYSDYSSSWSSVSIIIIIYFIL